MQSKWPFHCQATAALQVPPWPNVLPVLPLPFGRSRAGVSASSWGRSVITWDQKLGHCWNCYGYPWKVASTSRKCLQQRLRTATPQQVLWQWDACNLTPAAQQPSRQTEAALVAFSSRKPSTGLSICCGSLLHHAETSSAQGNSRPQDNSAAEHQCNAWHPICTAFQCRLRSFGPVV